MRHRTLPVLLVRDTDLHGNGAQPSFGQLIGSKGKALVKQRRPFHLLRGILFVTAERLQSHLNFFGTNENFLFTRVAEAYLRTAQTGLEGRNAC